QPRVLPRSEHARGAPAVLSDQSGGGRRREHAAGPRHGTGPGMEAPRPVERRRRWPVDARICRLRALPASIQRRPMSGAGGRLSSPAPASERSPARESNLALTVSDLGKCYRIYARPADRLRQAIFGRLGRSYYVEKWALRDVSFELERGAAMGIVGRNGAGKSTLLQIIAGTLAPTTGRVIAAGRVVALLELGSGFNPEFTGRENVFLYGALYGLTRAEMESRFDPIAAFADIGAYMDLPLKTYSSGMGVRLAFAVIAHLDPDILIVDEA